MMPMAKKKSQVIGEVFKYGLVLFLGALVVGIGYKFVTSINEKACQTELAKFEIELGSLDHNIRQGEKELQSFSAPCSVDKIYFFDINKNIDPALFSGIPLISESISTGGTNNVFLIKSGKVTSMFSAGNIEIDDPHYLCLSAITKSIEFYVEGQGSSVKITKTPQQRLCN